MFPNKKTLLLSLFFVAMGFFLFAQALQAVLPLPLAWAVALTLSTTATAGVYALHCYLGRRPILRHRVELVAKTLWLFMAVSYGVLGVYYAAVKSTLSPLFDGLFIALIMMAFLYLHERSMERKEHERSKS